MLVPWSYGGVVVGEYLRHHGGAAVGGILLHAAAVAAGRSARAFYGPGMMEPARGLMSDDPATLEAATASFLRASSATPRPEFESVARAAMARCPGHVRRALLRRDADYRPDYARAGCAAVAVHGEQDQVVWPSLSEAAAAEIPGATLRLVPGAGHAVFLDAPEDFDDALLEVVARR